MKKKVWFKRLKTHLKGFGKDEQRRIFDFYEELYADKSEAGMSERRILAEFGSPEEAARRISGENVYDIPSRPSHYEDFSAGRYTSGSYAPPFQSGQAAGNWQNTGYIPPERPSNDGAPEYSVYHRQAYGTPVGSYKKVRFVRLFFTLILAVPWIAISFALFVAVWALIISLFACGFVMVAAGLFSIASTVYAGISGVAWLPYLGIALALIGLGFLFIATMWKAMKSSSKRNGNFGLRMKRTFRSLKNFCYC